MKIWKKINDPKFTCGLLVGSVLVLFILSAIIEKKMIPKGYLKKKSFLMDGKYYEAIEIGECQGRIKEAIKQEEEMFVRKSTYEDSQREVRRLQEENDWLKNHVERLIEEKEGLEKSLNEVRELDMDFLDAITRTKEGRAVLRKKLIERGIIKKAGKSASSKKLKKKAS
jgi:predicted nuclease with TOPRIM domain